MESDEKRPDQQEAGSGGEGFRGLEAGVSRWPHAGDDGASCPGPVDVLPHVL